MIHREMNDIVSALFGCDNKLTWYASFHFEFFHLRVINSIH